VIPGVAHADHLTAPLDLHGRQRAHALVKDSLELRLAEHQRFGPTRKAAFRVAADPDQHVAVRVPPLVDRRGLGARKQRVEHAGPLQYARDLVVQVHGARERIRFGPALEDADLPAALPEQDREKLADRAVADDRDVHDPRSHGSGLTARERDPVLGRQERCGTGGPQAPAAARRSRP
jgi:hypothetical protein